MRCAIRKVAMIDRMCRESELSRTREAWSIGLIRNHAHDFRVEPAVSDRLMQRTEVGASTGEQNSEPHYSIQDAKPLGGAS